MANSFIGLAMKKLINEADRYTRDSLEGLALCHPDLIELGPDGRYVRRKVPASGKVALISGGGSGHEPLHAGFVGYGMLDAACPGQIFTSPTPDQIVEAARAVDGGRGLLFIVKNYAGDLMNFEVACEEIGGGEVALLHVADEVGGGPSSGAGRRGIAGAVIVEKIIGAAAERGQALADIVRLGERVVSATRSMGLALTSCTVPAVGVPMFAVDDEEIELGVGIHGERGARSAPMQSAKALLKQLLEPVLDELSPVAGRDCLLLVNGLGATPPAELYIAAREANRYLTSVGVRPVRNLVGSYATSLDASGCSVTVSFLDAEMTTLWDAPVHTPALRWGV